MQIVCVEYLHAVAEEFFGASPSMQREAALMLSALVEDFGRIQDSSVRVLLGDGVPRPFLVHDMLQSVPVSDATDLRVQLQHQCSTADVVLLLAPECQSILTETLAVIEQHLPPEAILLNLDSGLSAVFSDKQATQDWLTKRGLPTIPTKLISGEFRDRLMRCHGLEQDLPVIPAQAGIQITTLDSRLRGNDGTRRSGADKARVRQNTSDAAIERSPADQRPNATESQKFVIKPRYGVGSEDVRLITSRTLRWDELPPSEADSPFIIQPFMEGIACSVGFLGGGADRPPTILPAAEQLIAADGQTLRYTGGRVPANSHVQQAVTPLAPRIAAALGKFHGYAGVDLIVGTDGNVQIVEMNPRLCTSYIGYRAVTEENLARRMLDPSDISIQWMPRSVQFSSDRLPDGVD